jgi:hypothetical protein
LHEQRDIKYRPTSWGIREVNAMPKLLVIFLSLTIGSLILSCGPRLSEEEAKTIISQHYGGKLVSDTILVFENNKNSPEDKKTIMALQKLISDGYVEIDETHQTYNHTQYKPTSKCRSYIKLSFDYRFSEDNLWTFDGTVARKVLKEINEILIDKQNNIATVTFTLKLEPVEPIYSLVCVSSNCRYFGLSSTSINDETMKVILKKWDKGWRMLGE